MHIAGLEQNGITNKNWRKRKEYQGEKNIILGGRADSTNECATFSYRDFLSSSDSPSYRVENADSLMAADIAHKYDQMKGE